MSAPACEIVRAWSPEEFFHTLVDELRTRSTEPTFRARWSGPKQCTAIMLGTSGNRNNSVLAAVLRRLGLPIGEQAVAETVSFERYGDLIYFGGEWFEGASHPEVHIEVENNFHELKGTISHLLFIQSHFKVAILYTDEHKGPEEWSEVFNAYPFCQNSDIRYIMIFLPTQVSGDFPNGAYAFWATAEDAKTPTGWERISG